MKNNFYRKVFNLIFVLLTYCSQLLAQYPTLELQRFITPSPTAAAMAKYGDIPLNAYTGTQNISIPIFDIKTRDITLPIILSYNDGGIKVSEEASWVGLGWTLQGPAQITRVVRGMDDLSLSTSGYPDSYLPTSINESTNRYVTPTNETTKTKDLEFLMEAVNGNVDAEPDVFNFNIGGRSGKFVLQKRASPSDPLIPLLISQSDLKIDPIYDSGLKQYRWIITDESGIKYYFATGEIITSRTGIGEDEESADNNSKEGIPTEVVSTWYIDSIVSPRKDKIVFSYLKAPGPGTQKVLDRSQLKEHVTQLYSPQNCDVTPKMNELTYISNYQEVQNVYLKTIEFPNGKIEFSLGNRLDIRTVIPGSTSDSSKRVNKITVFSKKNNSFSEIKDIVFNYSYFNSTDDFLSKRLKLLSVQESNGKDSLNPYVFEYNETPLPPKDSKSIDHWGYYNGANNQQIKDPLFFANNSGTLIPATTVYIAQQNQTKYLVGADREPNEDKAKAGILTKITYPTRGSTTFEYELNDYYSPRTIIDSVIRDAYIEKWGPSTGIPNLRKDTITIDLTQPSLVILNTTIQCTNAGSPATSCLGTGDEYEYDVAHIKSLPGTPSFEKWIGYTLTYENQDDGDLQESQIYLPAGKYKFTVFADESYVSRFIIDWFVKDTSFVKNKYGGGLRIKSVLNYDGKDHLNDKFIKYNYNDPEDSSKSSGKLMVEPNYEYEREQVMGCSTTVYELFAKSIVRYTSPTIPFGIASKGNIIGYSNVDKIINNKVKTSYQFLNTEDLSVNAGYPNVPSISHMSNGFLTKEKSYTFSSGTFNLVREDTISYVVEPTHTKWMKGMVVPNADLVYIYYQRETGEISGLIPQFNNVEFYDIPSRWMHKSEKTSTIYSQNSSNIPNKTTIKYYYDNQNWHQLTKVITQTSKGNSIETNYKYPYDYSITGTPTNNVAGGIKNLQAQHIINPVIEQYTRISDPSGSNYKVISAQLTIYKKTVPLQDTVFSLEIGAPTTSFTSASISSSNFSKSNYYKPQIIIDSYDTYYNITQQHRFGNSNEVYLWGYKGQYPVLKAIGSNYSTVKGLVNISVLDNASNYSIDQVRTELNKVRANVPGQGTQVNTFVYEPLTGVVSETDEKGKILNYEYDGLQRLKTIKDQNGKVLNTYSYKQKTL